MPHHSLPPTTHVKGAVQQGLAKGLTHGEMRELARTAHVPFDATQEFRRDAGMTHDDLKREGLRRLRVAHAPGVNQR